MRINEASILLCLFTLGSLWTEVKAQKMRHSEIGIQFKQVIPSAFRIYPEYDVEMFPHVSSRNGRSFGIQMSYFANINELWGFMAFIDGSLYSTGLSLYLTADEDPHPNHQGLYDFYDGLDAEKLSANIGIHYTIRSKWFDIKPLIGLSFSSHFEQLLTLKHGYVKSFPINSGNFKSVFRVDIERKHFIDINPTIGVYSNIKKISKLFNIILGCQYVFDRSASLVGSYEIDANSGQYKGDLSNTEERLEVQVGVNFILTPEIIRK